MNLYCYCGNDPVNRFDPSGNIGIGIVISVAFIGVGLLLLLKSDAYKEVMDEPTNHLKYTFDNGDVIYYKINYNEKNLEKSQIEVLNSYKYSRNQINEFLTYLKMDSKNSAVNIDRIRNEWIYHNLAYGFNFKPRQTGTVNVYFNSDDTGHGIFSWVMNNIRIF